jgi:hypothetical protein
MPSETPGPRSDPPADQPRPDARQPTPAAAPPSGAEPSASEAPAPRTRATPAASSSLARLRKGLLSIGVLVLGGLIAWATSYVPTRVFEQGGQDAGPPLAIDVSRGPVLADATWDDCRGYVIPRVAASIPPPPPLDSGVTEARRRWAEALGGADAGKSWVSVTVQGRSPRSVVLQGLRVRIVEQRPPPRGTTVTAACGGPVDVRLVTVDLDTSPPRIVRSDLPDVRPADPEDLTPVRFPYTVSDVDPEQFAIVAVTERCDCTWTAELLWLDQGRRGVTRIDDGGKPFRTIATRDAPRYRSARGERLVPAGEE